MAKTCSIGLRSGEYFGRNTRRAPTSRIEGVNVENTHPIQHHRIGCEESAIGVDEERKETGHRHDDDFGTKSGADGQNKH